MNAKPNISLCLIVAALIALAPTRARSLEVFGVQVPGTATDAEAVIAEGLQVYTAALSLTIATSDDELQSHLRESSLLVTQAKAGVADTASLVARARADEKRLTAALYAKGFYGPIIDIRIAGQSLDAVDLTAAPVANTHATHPPLDVTISITPGQQFRFGRIQIEPNQRPTDAGPLSLDAIDYGLEPGAVAQSTAIVAASEKLVHAWRAAGYPLARVDNKDVEADHETGLLHVAITIAPGDPAVFGWVNISGNEDLETGTIAAQSRLQSGERFSPKDLKTVRDRLQKLESVESVRIVEGETVDSNGGIPVTIEVTERKPRYFGATASVSSIDGGEIQTYWGHRNLFGGSEKLRVDATVSQIGSETIDQLQVDTGVLFTKPGILDVDTDLFSEFRVKRENPDTYDSLSGTAQVGLNRIFSPTLAGSVAIKGAIEQVDDAFGRNTYATASLPTQLVYDTRDSKLDPSSGMVAAASVKPTLGFNDASSFVASESQVSAYHAVDPDARLVIAGRVAAGSIAGASLSEVPASSRFFAGGGGSVRGYQYRTLGPTIAGDVVGGLSFASASLEARWRVTEHFGVVPFVDIASVSDDSWFSFSDTPFVGAGVGLRYYTALGPLRLDLAVPLTAHDDQPRFGVYVGLGQAF